MASTKQKFYIINVKIQSEKTGDQRILAYEEMFKSLSSSKHFTRLNSSEAITMYPAYEREEGDVKYYYGVLGKGISFFDKDEINVMSDSNLSKEVVDKNRLLEPKVADYIFIPSIHRFALMKKANSISVLEFEKFLRDHLFKYVGAEEKLEIVSEKEPAIIDEIFKAHAVYKLSYEITYSNSDALPAQGELFDKLLKKTYIGKLSVTAQADHHEEGMQIDEVDFLGGGLEVAKNNGVIKAAKIRPVDGGKIKTIFNNNKPLEEGLEYSDDDVMVKKWAQKLINLY